MLKRLTFTEDPDDRLVFEQLWDGLLIGSQPRGGAAPKARAEIRRESALQKKLRAVSDPTPVDQIDPGVRPREARTLKPGVQHIDLMVEEITLAGQLIEKVAWGGAQIIGAAEVFDRLEGAPNAPETPVAPVVPIAPTAGPVLVPAPEPPNPSTPPTE